MPCKKIIVVMTYHLGADDFWDIGESLVLKYSLDFLPAFRETCNSECFCFLIFVLKFGQPQFYASNVSNVGTISSDLSSEGAVESVELGQDSRSVYQNLVKRR